MIKLCGAALIVAAGTLWGQHKGDKLSLRAQYLQDMLDMLAFLQTDIHYRRTPTFDLLRAADLHCCHRRLPLSFENLSAQLLPQTLNAALSSFEKACEGMLSAEEQMLFCSTLRLVGSAVAQEQEDALAYACKVLHPLCERAQKKARDEKKLYRVLGACAGLAVVLLIL